MTFTTRWRGLLATVLIACIAAVAPVRAQDDLAAAPWQDVITAQVEAFRQRDAAAAFSFAGAGFQSSFPSSEAFFETIVMSGYSPIMTSVSHSFGRVQRLGETGVVQEVHFVGSGQELYGALYQLTEEEAGWRVQGVQLFRLPGVGI